jgi:hypothetical protein
MARKPKPKVIEAVGVAVGQMVGAERAQKMEAAQVKALNDAAADGITDPEKLRELMRKARESV